MCTKRAGSGGEDAESESGRLRTQERQIGLMNVGLRTGLRAGIESKKLRAEGAVYKSERLIMRLRTSCGECWGKSKSSRAKRSVPKDLSSRESADRSV